MLDFDTDKMCRVCLQTDLELFLLFDEQNAMEGVYLSNMISEMTIFTIRRYDDFPHQICLECMHRVRNAYELKKQFEQSHRKLLTYLESVNKITIDTTPNVQNNKCVQTEDSTLFPCEKCDDKFVTYQSLREHRIESHKGTANICRFCFKTFNRIGDLKNHIAVHHPEIKHFNPHECLICNRRFTRKEHVNRHMAKIHKIENTQMSEDEDNITNEIKSDANELEMLVETETEYGNLTKVEDTSDMLSNKDPQENDNDDESIGAADPFSSDEDDKPLAGLRNAINAKNKESETISIKVEPDDPATVPSDCVLKSEEIETDKKDESPVVENSQEGRKKYKCSICKKAFKRNSHLKRHFVSHVEEKPFLCNICDKRFTRADHLKSHMSKHDNTRAFKCDMCDRSYNRADILKRHKEKKHNADGQSELVKSEFHCEICSRSFSSKAYLQKHMGMHINKSWKCKLCPVGFDSKEALKLHNKSHAKEKPFLCSECGLRFVRNDYLLIHMRRHTGEKPYKCKYCDKGFPRATDLNVHVKYHTGEKTHLCTICGKGFQRSYNLVVHMRVHTGERPYTCSHCPKTFAQCNDLKAHIRRHTGERYKCELCGVGFVQGYLLTQHRISVHGIEGKARNGRVAKVKPNKLMTKDMSEDIDDPPDNIKSEPETGGNILEELSLIGNESPDE